VGASSAIEIARRVGLDPRLCAKAEENLKRTSGPLGEALVSLERSRHEAEQAKDSFHAQQRELESERASLQHQREALRERERAIQAEARAELVAEIEKVRSEVSAMIANLQAQPTVRSAVDAQSALAKVAEEQKRELERQKAVAQTAREERLPEGSPIVVGMRVRLPNLGEAQVLEVSGDEALVAAGVLKLRRKVSELVPLKGPPKKSQSFPGKNKKHEEKMRAAEQAAAGTIEYGHNRLDVRGMRAEEALRAVETFLDRSYGEGKTGALIVHGLGTGALKATVRDYLRSSPYIRGFRAGDDHEGGEGVTVIALGG
jgi:DNA mismatch repair protein MutS2